MKRLIQRIGQGSVIMNRKYLTLAFAVLYLAILACGSEAGTSVQTPLPTTAAATSTLLPTSTSAQEPATPSPAVAPANQAISAPEGDLAAVTQVIDGDTIEVALGGATYRVRYIGMDTPERGDPYFSEATDANRALVEGKMVILIKDVSKTDRYGRLLRYVYLEDGIFVNAELVKQGYAVVATFPPDIRHQDLFLTLEREAREASRGLWAQPFVNEPASTSPPLVNTPAPLPTAPPQPTEQANCDPSYPTVCIAPPPPDLNCGDIPHRNFTVLQPDPHHFDGDKDGIGCER